MTHNNTTQDTTHNDIHAIQNTTSQMNNTTTHKVLVANKLLKAGITHNLFTVVSMYAKDMSDYEIILDNEVEDFMIRVGDTL